MGQIAQARPESSARAPLLAFDDTQRALIAQLGPWPPAPGRDPGNRFSAQPAAIALGARLFADHRLSSHGRLACISCHVPALGLADGRPRGVGLQPLDRHTPGLWNLGQGRWFGWDGAFDSLWSQALQPLRHPAELAADAGTVRRLLAADPTLDCLARAAWGARVPPPPRRVASPAASDNASTAAPAAEGGEPDATDDALMLGVAKALGAFVASLASPRTPFDEFRDALMRGDLGAAARYPAAAQRGLQLFLGRGQCVACHGGPNFSHGEFGDIGLPFFVRPGVVDPGRHGGIARLLASPYNLLGAHSDAAGGADDPVALTTRHVVAQHRNFGEFKVPSLRNLAHSAPYGHAGQLATLADVVQHYSRLSPDRVHSDGEQLLRPLQLSAGEAADLEAFLRSLSTARAPALPRPALPEACAATGSRALGKNLRP